MLADRFVTVAVAAALGVLASLLTTSVGVAVIAKLNNISSAKIVRFAIDRPVADWPLSLQFVLVFCIFFGIFLAALTTYVNRRTIWLARPKDLFSSVAAKQLIWKSASSSPKIFGGKYAEEEFWAGVEDRGLVVGPPGTGKTAFLLNQVLKGVGQKMNFVALDIKPELHSILSSTLKNEGYRVLRLNPAADDANLDHWNPLAEIHDETAQVELCAALLPVRTPADAPFVESQRDWLKMAVFHVADQPGGSLISAFDLLSNSSDPNLLLKSITSSSSEPAQRLARRLQAGLAGQKPDPLILSGFSGALRSLDFLSLPGVRSCLGHSDFNARDVFKSENPASLFLQFDESKLGALAPVLSFLAAAMLTLLIDTAGQRKPVALFLDELGNMPALPGLAEKLNTIRSRQMPTWMYFQTVEQIDRRYGPGAKDVFLAATDVQMFFRLNDQSTRELVSRLVGTTWKLKYSRSQTERGNTVTTSREVVNTIEPHQLGSLRAGEVVTLYRGASACGWATPHYVDFPNFRRR